MHDSGSQERLAGYLPIGKIKDCVWNFILNSVSVLCRSQSFEGTKIHLFVNFCSKTFQRLINHFDILLWYPDRISVSDDFFSLATKESFIGSHRHGKPSSGLTIENVFLIQTFLFTGHEESFWYDCDRSIDNCFW